MLLLAEQSLLPRHQWKPELLTPCDEDRESFMNLAKVRDNILTFVERGYNLYICSTHCGNGKTTWSIKLMMAYFNKIWAGNGFQPRALFLHVPALLAQIKKFDDSVDFDLIKNIDLVIFDDIATTNMSDFEYNQLLNIIDARVLGKKSCIFTSNLVEIEELGKAIGTRLASRIYNTSNIIEFKGNDKRGVNRQFSYDFKEDNQ